MIKEDNYDFSFSGLKSAALNHINKAKMKNEAINKADLCASFRKCVCDILIMKTMRAAKDCNINSLSLIHIYRGRNVQKNP